MYQKQKRANDYFSFLFLGQSVMALCPLMGFLQTEQTGRALAGRSLCSTDVWPNTAINNRSHVMFAYAVVLSGIVVSS